MSKKKYVKERNMIKSMYDEFVNNTAIFDNTSDAVARVDAYERMSELCDKVRSMDIPPEFNEKEVTLTLMEAALDKRWEQANEACWGSMNDRGGEDDADVIMNDFLEACWKFDAAKNEQDQAEAMDTILCRANDMYILSERDDSEEIRSHLKFMEKAFEERRDQLETMNRMSSHEPDQELIDEHFSDNPAEIKKDEFIDRMAGDIADLVMDGASEDKIKEAVLLSKEAIDDMKWHKKAMKYVDSRDAVRECGERKDCKDGRFTARKLLVVTMRSEKIVPVPYVGMKNCKDEYGDEMFVEVILQWLHKSAYIMIKKM